METNRCPGKCSEHPPVSRREFITAGSLAPLTGGLSPAWAQPAAARSSSFDPWVEVHAGNLRHNVAEIRRRVGGRPILAVIKNNGYGAGVVKVARALEPLESVAGFAVVKLQEAVTLRDAGLRKPVLLMGPFAERDLEEAVTRDIMPMVYTPVGPALDRLAARYQHPVRVHVCIDHRHRSRRCARPRGV